MTKHGLTLSETNSKCSENKRSPKETTCIVFQALFFRCELLVLGRWFCLHPEWWMTWAPDEVSKPKRMNISHTNSDLYAKFPFSGKHGTGQPMGNVDRPLSPIMYQRFCLMSIFTTIGPWTCQWSHCFQVHAFANQSTLAPSVWVAFLVKWFEGDALQTLGVVSPCLFVRGKRCDLSVSCFRLPVTSHHGFNKGGKIRICCAKGRFIRKL